MTLEELADRVEAATGPDRELDCDIARMLGVTVMRRNHEDTANEEHTYWRYTESLDSALSLVPEGFDWIIGRTNGGLTIHAEVGGRGNEFMRFGDTPALALCAAALRARSTEGGDNA